MIQVWIRYYYQQFFSQKEFALFKAIYTITTFLPKNIKWYKQALQHKSVVKSTDTNERLEFLGDAILTLVTAEYLFQKYPQAEEGVLTQWRANMNNRRVLNAIAYGIKIHKLIQHNLCRRITHQHNVLGNTLEALIGAIYLDRGYRCCKKFIIDKVFNFCIKAQIVEQNLNYKGKIYEWSQKEKVRIQFLTQAHNDRAGFFYTKIILKNKIIAEGIGQQKKISEQAAAEKACQVLNI